ncbi:uncharacterized protein [Montipora capricornis]|uniref:uncharacterized protein isoform X2 n=1 Tax=Montipora capricornis TaxID=246305 RepID=UPI0035F17986
MALKSYGSSETLDSIVSSECTTTSANTSNSLTPSEFSQSGEDRQDEDFPPQDANTPWQVGSLQPGSYCVYRYSPLHREERSFEWDPKPSKGIISQKGCDGCQRTIVSFFQNPEKFIQKMDTAGDLCKERREQFILLEILPHLEESWGRCYDLNKRVYKQLAKLSGSVSGGQVVKHSLQLLLHLICKDNFERGHESLLELEGIMRSSIFSDEGVFRKDGQCERTLKLLVYSRILSLLLKPDVLQDQLLVADLENDLKRIVEELQRHQKQVKCKKKDTLRYSIEFTIMLFSHSCLLKPSESLPTDGKMETFLEECQEFCVNARKESKDLTLLERLRKRKKNLSWAELHSILYHLHGKVHSERPNPKMDTERRALILIRLIVEAFLSGGGGEDWRFCLAASLLLVEIAKNNTTKVMRQEAALTLVYLLRDKKVQDRPECRALLENRASELLFSSDPEIRKIMIHFLSHNQQEAVALPAERHKEHLSSTYKTQTLEINNTIVSHSAECFISTGMFQRKKVAVKVLNVKKNHLLADNPDFEARRRLINEADNMRRLSESQHPNFPVLLGFDTINMPFHIITAFEKWGNLRQFLQLRRDMAPYVQPVDLLKMLTGICRALSHIEALGLVHRCVNAENILVGDNFECKLSGLHSLRPLTFEQSDQDSLYEGYTPLEIPQYIGKPTDEDLPVRWQAPECLMNHRFSTASDVWAFGVVMYEVLTYGCTPYRHLLEEEEVSHQIIDLKEIVPQESCLENREYELIKKCCKWECAHRPRFTDIMNQLDQIIHNSDKGKPRPGPPPLEVDIKAGGSHIASDGEAVYSTIADILKDVNLDSTEKDDNKQSDIYDDLVADYFITENQGSIWTWERLSQQDVQHATELRRLNHPNIVPIWKQGFFNSFRWIASRPNYPHGNLKEYVLQRQCKKENIEMFLSQVASACHYLHSKHIVHGALRAEYINVLSPNQVQIGRLGRSKSLSMSAYEVTSTSCVAQTTMPLDASRWSAPEVILDGYYSHASDVWAFGILAWELYASYQYGQEEQQFSRPYHWLDNDEILPYQRDSGPLSRPECCPDWVYILMHQCWAFDSKQRPPFLAIFDCLTSRKPMKAWIMQLWLKTHNEGESPDLSVSQETDAPHVLGEDSHPSERNIERMCSEEFFAQHRYKYVERSDAYGPKERSEKSVNSSDSPPTEQTRQVDEAKVSDYSCPVTDIMCPCETRNQTIDVVSGNGDYEKWIKENKNALYATESSSKDELQYAELRICGINRSRWELDHGKGGAYHAPDYEFNNHEWVRAGHTAHAANKASDADGNCEIHADKEEAFTTINKDCKLNEIHYKRPARLPKERQYNFPRKCESAQEDRIGTGETQSFQPKKKAKREPKIDEDIYDRPIVTSGDSPIKGMNANGSLEDKKGNASLEEACNVEPNSFQEENSGTICSQGDAGAPTESGNSDIETTQTNKMDVDRSPVHYQQPSNIPKDTECQRNGETARDRASPLRRKNAMRRKKRQNFQYKREAKCKPDDKENVCENKTSPHESQRKHVYESETVLMEDERDESPLQEQAITMERHNSVLQRQLTSIVVDLSL